MMSVKNHHSPATIRVDVALEFEYTLLHHYFVILRKDIWLPWHDVTTLLHQRSDSEPHGIQNGKVVLQNVRLLSTRMWVVPLVRGNSTSQECRIWNHRLIVEISVFNFLGWIRMIYTTLTWHKWIRKRPGKLCTCRSILRPRAARGKKTSWGASSVASYTRC